jgi:hypothetical protein
MTADFLAEGLTNVQRGDFVGLYARAHEGVAVRDFGVAHVALVQSVTTRHAAKLVVVEAGIRGVRVHEADADEFTLVGSLQLSEAQEREILVWAHEISTSGAQAQYVCVPAYAEGHDANDTLVRKVSCAGLVVEAYRAAGVTLLVNEAALPRLKWSDLVSVWGVLLEYTHNTKTRRRLGLEAGSEPWPVLLPGYLFHAIESGSRAHLPFQPTAAHLEFP